MISLQPFRRKLRRRLWLAEATNQVLETVSHSTDVLEILRLWAKEISQASKSAKVALFLSEGDRWLRILPESQRDEVPFFPEATLATVLTQRKPLVVAPIRPQDFPIVMASYAARDGWRGVVAIWSTIRGVFVRQTLDVGELANAIGRSLSALRRAETIREEALVSERARLALELHDGFLQSLLSAKLHAEVCLSLGEQHSELCMSFGMGPSERLATELVRTRDLLEGTARDVRRFLLELRSPPSSVEEFLPWLRDYADDFAHENGILVEVRVEGDGTLSKNQAGEAICLVREALTNIRRHAKASRARVVVAFSERGTTISVSDDGVGFDVRSTLERMLDSSHNGLIGLRYRTESIGGTLRVRSEPGKGTTLQFRLPPPQKRATAELELPREKKLSSAPSFQSEGPSENVVSLHDSIRATLAEMITSFLEQEALASTEPPGDAQT